VSYCNVIHIDGNVVDAKANTCEHYVIGMLLSLDLMLPSLLTGFGTKPWFNLLGSLYSGVEWAPSIVQKE
jgi:hypothetical protein